MTQIDFDENKKLHVKYTDDYEKLDYYVKAKDINKIVITFFNAPDKNYSVYTITDNAEGFSDEVELDFNKCNGVNEYDHMLDQMSDLIDYDKIIDETNQYRNFKFIDIYGEEVDITDEDFVYCDIEITNNYDGTANVEYNILDTYDDMHKTDKMLLKEMKVVPLAERIANKNK